MVTCVKNLNEQWQTVPCNRRGRSLDRTVSENQLVCGKMKVLSACHFVNFDCVLEVYINGCSDVVVFL